MKWDDLGVTYLNHVDRIARLVLADYLGRWVVKRGLRYLVNYKSRRDKS